MTKTCNARSCRTSRIWGAGSRRAGWGGYTLRVVREARWVFNRRLKVSNVFDSLIAAGNSFQIVGAEKLKERLLRLVVQKGIDRRFSLAERRHRKGWSITTPCPDKKRVYSILGITSSNTGRFSKFFHFRNLFEICNKAVAKYPTSPQTHHYTTLWNIDVRKLACPACALWQSFWKINSPVSWGVASSSYIFKWNLYTTTYFTNLLYQVWYCL